MSDSSPIEVAAATGYAASIEMGRSIRITDIAGGQVVDTWAFCLNNPADEYLSAEHTRPTVGKLFPAVGEAFVSNRRREILRFEADTSPGIHDMLIAPCDQIRYEQYGYQGKHPSCQENLILEMTRLGHAGSPIPQPINLFMNTPVLPDGNVKWLSTQTKPGDSVTFRALLDVILVVSACPMDMTNLNAKPGPISLTILED